MWLREPAFAVQQLNRILYHNRPKGVGGPTFLEPTQSPPASMQRVANVCRKAWKRMCVRLFRARKSPIEWIMEHYAVTVNRDSQIRNDPNDWCREHGQPRYILDLIGRIVNVSIQTLDLMASLPPLSFKT